jgi:hypothetical protein
VNPVHEPDAAESLVQQGAQPAPTLNAGRRQLYSELPPSRHPLLRPARPELPKLSGRV